MFQKHVTSMMDIIRNVEMLADEDYNLHCVFAIFWVSPEYRTKLSPWYVTALAEKTKHS